MGHGYATRPILYEMEKQSLANAPRNRISRIIWGAYGKPFGFGYSSLLAIMTLVTVFCIGWIGFYIAEQPNFAFDTTFTPTPERTVSIDVPSRQPPQRQTFSCSFAQSGYGPVVYECVDPTKSSPNVHPHPAALRKIFAGEKGPYDWSPPCEMPSWLYGIDVMLPIVDLGVESVCDFPDEAWNWHFFRLGVALAGTIAIPLAALTFAGLLQRQ